MNEITTMFENTQIRIIDKEDGTWFVAKDVSEFFGDSNYKRSLRGLDDDEKGVTHMNTPGGMQDVNIINESGLYHFLFNLTPQKAPGTKKDYVKKRIEKIHKFKRWITHDVLPSIRRTGSYSVPANVPAMQYMDAKTIQHLSTIMQSFSEMARDCSIMSEQLGYYRQFAPTGDYGDLNRDGVPRYQKRRGYFVSNRGADVSRSENPEKSNYHQLDLFYDRLPEILIQSAKILQDKFAALNSPKAKN